MADDRPFDFVPHLNFTRIVFKDGPAIWLPERVISSKVIESTRHDSWVVLLFQNRCVGFGRDYYCALTIEHLSDSLEGAPKNVVGFHLFAPVLSFLKSAAAWVADVQPFERLNAVHLLVPREEVDEATGVRHFPEVWEQYDLSATLQVGRAGAC